jgi:hypothetical protein
MQTLIEVRVVVVTLAVASAQHDGARQELDDAVDGLGDDELRVLTRIAMRLRRGQETYGRVHAATDRRDFKVEAREELDDFLVYDALRWLKDDARGSVH